MECVGMSHRYQKAMLMVFAPYWFIASLFLFQQLYTFQEPTYVC
jgi:predicted membrane-bound mannosyltransferase